MTTTPRPKTVREIAREAVRQAVQRGRDAVVDLAVAEYWPEAVNPEFLRHRDVVAAEYDRLADALEWPDEQPQDDGDVRAVAAYLGASHEDAAPTDPHPRTVLRAHFADRIAALEARDAKGGE